MGRDPASRRLRQRRALGEVQLPAHLFRPEHAGALLEALLAEGLEPDEVRDALPYLPVLADTAEALNDLLAGLG